MSLRYEAHRQSRCALTHEQIFEKRQSEHNYIVCGTLQSKSVPFEILDRLQANRIEKEEKHESRRERYAAEDRRVAAKRERELEERKKKRLQQEARQSGSHDPVVSHRAQHRTDQREYHREELRVEGILRSRANDNDFFHQAQLHRIKREAWQLRFDKNILGLDGYVVPKDQDEETDAPTQAAPNAPKVSEDEVPPILDIWAHIPSPDEEDAKKGKDTYAFHFGRDSKVFSKRFVAPKTDKSQIDQLATQQVVSKVGQKETENNEKLKEDPKIEEKEKAKPDADTTKLEEKSSPKADVEKQVGTSKTEEKQAETPQAEDKVTQTKEVTAPTVEASKTEEKETKTVKSEPAKTDEKVVEAPKTEQKSAPKPEPTKTEPPKAETPKPEQKSAPQPEPTKTDEKVAPTVESPKVEAPKTEQKSEAPEKPGNPTNAQLPKPEDKVSPKVEQPPNPKAETQVEAPKTVAEVVPKAAPSQQDKPVKPAPNPEKKPEAKTVEQKSEKVPTTKS